MGMFIRNRRIESGQITGCSALEGLCGEEDAQKPSSALFPRTNLYEEVDHWLYTFELPGVDPAEVEIILKDHRLSIRGKRTSFHQDHKSRIHTREGCIGACGFAKTVTLPTLADPNSLRINLQNGMLLARLRKRSVGQTGETAAAPEDEGSEMDQSGGI